MSNTDLSDMMKLLAEKIGNLPATGMIEAESALPIIGEMVAITMAAIDLADDHKKAADMLYNEYCMLWLSTQVMDDPDSGLLTH